MKKRFSICSLVFACALMVFAGCGANTYLLTTQTTLNPASFYSNYYCGNITYFDNVNGSTLITSETDKVAYANYVKPIYEVLPQERCLISVLDYLCAVNDDSNNRLDDKTTTKVYEYAVLLKDELSIGAPSVERVDYTSTKAVVLVKGANNNAELSAYLFYKDANEVCEIASLINNTAKADFKFTFRQTKYNIQTKTYSLSYGTNTANATFNADKGFLSYEISTYLGSSTQAIKIEKNIYKYANGTVAVRIITTDKQGTINGVAIYEQLCKDFYQRAKVGLVKDASLILSLETMQEEKLAKANTSDLTGFSLEYNTQNDVNGTVSCVLYGTH